VPALFVDIIKERKAVSITRYSIILGAALFVGAFFQGCSSSPSLVRAASVKPNKDRHEAPDFALKDADGKTVHLTDYRGKVVMLDFWATWCPPCKVEIPWLIDIERKNKDRGFAVLGVSMDDEGWEVVKPFMKEVGMNYRVVIGNDATAEIYGNVESLPETFLIDREGKIAAIHIGLASRKDFEDEVAQLLGPPEKTDVPAHVGLYLAPVRPGAK
jgi:cytochrome c biogenesis protein CcmG/thiol:disulfide interchange protein DsbE